MARDDHDAFAWRAVRVVALVEFLAGMKPSEAYLYEWLVGAKRVSDDAVARRVDRVVPAEEAAEEK